MANSTETYWSIDGVSLQTLAWNISTWGGNRQALPPLRGSDLIVPARIGQIWQPKTVDSRTITLEMWVVGSDSDGRVPADKSIRRQFEENWLALRKLLWVPNRQVQLTKRFYPPGSTTLVTATAMAEWAGGLVPEMSGTQTRAMFSVDFKLTHPFFVGDPVLVPFPSTARTKTLVVPGDYPTNDITLEYNGAITNPRVNVSGQGYLQYTGALVTGDKATVTVEDFKTLVDPATGSDYYASGKMTSSLTNGQWLQLLNGSNPVTVSGTGSGLVNLTYRPQWL